MAWGKQLKSILSHRMSRTGSLCHMGGAPGGEQAGLARSQAHDALVADAQRRPDGDALLAGPLHCGADVLQRPHQRELPVLVRKCRQPAAGQAQRLRPHQ